MLKRFILGLGILALLATGVQAAGLFPLSNAQQLDANGKIIPGARLFLYDGGTTTPRIAYKDLALTTPHPNPILADSAGRIPLVYLDDGYYRQRLTTKTGTLIFDQDGIPVLTTSAGGTGTSVDPDSVLKTGDFKLAYTDQPVSGFVRANGRTIGSASSGATERANSDTQALYEHLWAFANISVSGGKGASAAADYAANKPLVLPDVAGRSLVGSDDLGAGARSILTSTYCTGPTLPGAVCGAQSLTLASTNLPVTSPWVPGSVSGSGSTDISGAHTHNIATFTTAGRNSQHQHNVPINTLAIQQGGGAGATVYAPAGSPSALTSDGDVQDHSHNSNASMDSQGSHFHNVTVTGSVSLGSNAGGGQAVNKLPPLLTVMILIRL